MSVNIDTLENVDVERVYEFLFKKFSTNSDRGLSLAMGLSESAVRGSRHRNSIPWEGVIVACKRHGISLDEIFEIDVTTHIDKATRSEEPDKPAPLCADDLLAANAMVEKVLDDALYERNLPANIELQVCKKLRPVLIKAVFEHNFNEIFVKSIAKGALVMV